MIEVKKQVWYSQNFCLHFYYMWPSVNIQWINSVILSHITTCLSKQKYFHRDTETLCLLLLLKCRFNILNTISIFGGENAEHAAFIPSLLNELQECSYWKSHNFCHIVQNKCYQDNISSERNRLIILHTKGDMIWNSGLACHC